MKISKRNFWEVPKKVLRYLKKTHPYVLCYSHVDNLKLICYADSDLGGCVDDRMSTSGYIFMFVGGDNILEKKKSNRAVLTMEYESIGCFEAMRQGSWMKNLIYHMKIVRSIERRVKNFCDNTAVVFFAKNNKRSEVRNWWTSNI